MSVDVDLSIEKEHLLSEKKINSLKTDKIFLKTAQHCSTERIETIFGVFGVTIIACGN